MTISSRIRTTALIICSAIALSLLALAVPAHAAEAFPIQNQASRGASYCLGIKGGLKTPGTPAVVWTCNGHLDQQWHWGDTVSVNGINYSQLVNGLGQCLGTNGGAIYQGVGLVSYTCYGPSHPDQWWDAPQFTDCNNGHFIYNEAAVLDSNFPGLLVVGTQGGVISDGTPIVLWNFQSSCNNQMWVSTWG
jgi:hypothetical protein